MMQPSPLLEAAGGDRRPPSASDCELFWNVHVPRLLARGRRTPLAGLSGSLRFLLQGEGGGVWTIRIEAGVLGDVESPGSGEATAVVTMSAADFIAIVFGRLDHQRAFFDGRIDAAGDVALLLSLAPMVPLLRARFPFDPAAARRGE
jgi:hypothetical protein